MKQTISRIERVEDGEKKIIVVGRSGELKITDEKTGIVIMNTNIPYGSELLVKKNKTKIKKGDVICKWDPYNALIISEFKGKVAFENIIKGITYREEVDEQTGFTEKVITELKDRKKPPAIHIIDPKSKEVLFEYSFFVILKMVNEGDKIDGCKCIGEEHQEQLVKQILLAVRHVTELFEARNPSNPAVVSEIEGVASYGNIKRGNREIIITPKVGNDHKVFSATFKAYSCAAKRLCSCRL